MNKLIYKKSLAEAKKLMRLIDDPHGKSHTKAVAKNSIIIGKKLNYQDLKLLKLAAYWHDTKKPSGEKAEQLSAQAAKENLLSLGENEETSQKIYDAIILHKWNMMPKTLEGKIIRDADKLDFISIKRYKKAKQKNDKYIKLITPLLPKLRDLFSYEITKKLYDKRVKKFNKIINKKTLISEHLI